MEPQGIHETQSMDWKRLATVAAILAGVISATEMEAQSFRRGGTEFNALRPVVLPGDSRFAVMVVQFFHHGQIAPDGRNVFVTTRDDKLVPSRVMQLGPGDYCRLAFQPTGGQRAYEVCYGGPPPRDEIPGWTSRDGLVLETRQYKDCNLNSLESVREAFESAAPIGADYVENVHHSHNPFALKPAPFLSKYSGWLNVPSAGTYGFLTSSQDCSFLLIDDKLVVDAPGRHGPARQAVPGSRKDVTLSAGAHKFEYYHAASGPEAVMVAAWEPSPAGPTPKPTAIPAENFRAALVGRVQVGTVTMRDEKLMPDFAVNISGDVPLPENDEALIGVKFIDLSPAALTSKSKMLWDFGDGQTSEEPNAFHVYLRPGLYTVKLTVKRGGRDWAMANRVHIDRPTLMRSAKPETLAKLDDYLPTLNTYDASKLDLASLRQLVLAYQWKAESLLAAPENSEGEEADAAEEKTDAQRKAEAKALEEKKSLAKEYLGKAVAAGKAAFADDAATTSGGRELLELARLVATMARNEVGDSPGAAQIWRGAGRRLRSDEFVAACAIEVGDIALNDENDPKTAKLMLDAATQRMGQTQTGELASRLYRVWGDYHAAVGDGKAARKSYVKAAMALPQTRSHIEATAWRGARSRSAEEFVKTAQFDRAIQEIRAWEAEFPEEKIEGYLTLLYAQYWAGLEKHDQAIAMAEQLQAVNPDSAYLDQVLMLAAESELKRGRPDRAIATLESLLKDQPGSPLVPQIRKRIAEINASGQKGPRGR